MDLNISNRTNTKFGDEDPILELLYTVLLQGIECAVSESKILPITYDNEWVFNKLDNRPLSFNWYCVIFNLDPNEIRKLILKRIKTP